MSCVKNSGVRVMAPPHPSAPGRNTTWYHISTSLIRALYGKWCRKGGSLFSMLGWLYNACVYLICLKGMCVRDFCEEYVRVWSSYWVCVNKESINQLSMCYVVVGTWLRALCSAITSCACVCRCVCGCVCACVCACVCLRVAVSDGFGMLQIKWSTIYQIDLLYTKCAIDLWTLVYRYDFRIMS